MGTPRKNIDNTYEAIKAEYEKRFAELEARVEKQMKLSLHQSFSSPAKKSNRADDHHIDQISLELQGGLASLKSKLDAFSAKVDSIDLSYDKRISNLEATLSPLL